MLSLTEYLSIVFNLSLPSKPPNTYINLLIAAAAANAHFYFYKGSIILHSSDAKLYFSQQDNIYFAEPSYLYIYIYIPSYCIYKTI